VDTGELFINSVIIHQVPKRPVKGGGEPLKLSGIESELTDGLANFFRESIIKSLKLSSYRVVFDGATDSPVPNLVHGALCHSENDFVAMSRHIAEHLYVSQTGSMSSGLLTVMQASVAAAPAIAILKLEKESGIRVQEQQRHGMSTFAIEHIPDLMLSEKTKVFKVGLFVHTGDTVESIEGSISDNQRGRSPTTEVADFFLTQFLGCRLYEAPEVTTKHFLQTSEAFINEKVQDPELKARYDIGLLATLSSEETEINPDSFARSHLILSDRQRYVEFVENAGIPPNRPFRKDLSLVANSLKRVKLAFAGGAFLLAPTEQFDDVVHVELLNDGRTRATIEDTLTNINGKR